MLKSHDRPGESESGKRISRSFSDSLLTSTPNNVPFNKPADVRES